MTALDLSAGRRIHCVGIGGAGISAIATVLHTMGHQVSGSDLRDSLTVERLRLLGIRVEIGHRAENLGDADGLCISTAIGPANPEVAAAAERGIPVHSRAETLQAIAGLRRTIAVSGTHGKTTTSSMLALMLVEAGLAPSFVIGGDVNQIGTNAVWDEGDWFVVEADESDGTFLVLGPEIVTVTNVEPDHLEHYGSFDVLKDSFAAFMSGSRLPPVVSADDPVSREVAGSLDVPVVTVGQAPSADYRIEGFTGDRSSCSFELIHGTESLGRFNVLMPGLYNARNAAAAAATAISIGVGAEDVRRALARFAGVGRRFEFRGEWEGVTLVDDYAHLPGEVAAALEVARQGGWERVVCCFQPHRYSRTQSLWRDFADAFVDADVLVVTGIYASGEEPRPGVSGQLIADAVTAAHEEAEVHYLPARQEVLAFLAATLRPGDLLITLGAGDLTTLPSQIVAGALRPMSEELER